MRAVVIERPGDVLVVDRARPTPAPTEVCIRVAYCGVCGTDLHVLDGEFLARYPIVPGHELSGIVESVGSDVSRVQVGDRVTVDPNLSCGRCDPCREGNPHFCEDFMGMGTLFDGGFAEYVVCPEKLVYELPLDLPLDDAALTEPVSCCLHGIERLGSVIGRKVVIIGAGAIGLIMVQLARLAGAAGVCVIEPVEQRREMALRLGADHAVHPSEAADGLTRAWGKPDRADIVIECVGRPETAEASLRYAARGAQVLWFGVAHPDATAAIPPEWVFRRELTILGSFVNPHSVGRTLALLASGRLNLKPLITERYSLEKAADALAAHRRSEGYKILVTPAIEEG